MVWHNQLWNIELSLKRHYLFKDPPRICVVSCFNFRKLIYSCTKNITFISYFLFIKENIITNNFRENKFFLKWQNQLKDKVILKRHRYLVKNTWRISVVSFFRKLIYNCKKHFSFISYFLFIKSYHQ